MRFLPPILFSVFLIISCDNSEKHEVYNENNTTVMNGVVYDINEKPINGLYKAYYPDGTVKMEVLSQNGLPEGLGKFYNEDGSLLFKGTFKQGKPNGFMVNYYPDGKIHNEINYQDGLLHGFQKIYDTKGNVIVDVTFDNGKAINGYSFINGEKIELTPEELSELE